VQTRLQSWRTGGFLLGHEVWPNPRVFGAELRTVDIPVRSPADVDQLFLDLSLVDGVISARDLLDDDGRTVRAYLIDDGGTSLERRRRLVRRVAGLDEEPEAQPYWVPEPSAQPTQLDWRIIAYYRSHPTAHLSEAAASLRISPKTLSTRRDRLLDSGAIWWLMNTLSARFPVISVFATLTDRSDAFAVKQAIASTLTGWIPCADDGFGLSPSAGVRIVSGLAMVDTPACIDDVVRTISSIPGVASVRWRVPRDFRSYPEWFDHQIHIRLDGRGDAGRLARPLITGTPEPKSASPPLVARFEVDAISAASQGPPVGLVEGAPLSEKSPTGAFVARRPRRVASAGPSV
jgi:hypothetical protein